MKYLSCLTFVLLLTSCAKQEQTEKNECQEVEYEKSFSMRIDEKVCFPDGNEFSLELITSEICPCLAYCIWQGEIRFLLETNDGNGQSEMIEYGSESYQDQKEIFANYKIKTLEYSFDDPSYQECSNNITPEDLKLNLVITSN